MNDFVKDILKETKECVEEIEKIQLGYDYYYLFVWGCVEPELIGPFNNHEDRDEDMTKKIDQKGEDKHIYITFNVTKGAEIEF